MGRAKLNMELIADKKSRNTTFNNRKDGLIKKTHELATLCDVSACIIIYGPKLDTGFIQPEIWPPSADEVRGIITDVYKSSKNKDSGSRTFGLSDFFNGRKRKIEGDLAKLRKKNMESVYPTRPEVMNFMSEARLREFAATLSNKSDYVKSRIELLRRRKQGIVSVNHGLAQSHRLNNLGLRGIESHAIPHYPTIDQYHQNSTMMRLLNGGRNCVQFGAGPSDFQRQASYEAMGHGPKPLARLYGPDLPFRVQVPYMPVVPYMPPPLRLQEPQLWTRAEKNGQEDVVTNDQYHMNYKRARYYN